MRAVKALRGVWVAACVAVSLLLVVASGAFASESIYLCVPTKAGAAVKSGGETGTCEESKTTKYRPVALPAKPAEQQKLLSILPHIKYVASGVGGRPTIQVSSANLQILSGLGPSTGEVTEVNGAGNLIIGYDEYPGTQTGSENLVLGAGQTYTSYGAILGGAGNTASGPGSVAFGYANRATGEYSSVSGGRTNIATGSWSSASGGSYGAAIGGGSSVSGGYFNIASGGSSSISGGYFNTASGEFVSVSGGFSNTASGWGSSLSGGDKNRAKGDYSSVNGGLKNTASGRFSTILGGKENTLLTEFGTLP